MAYGSHVRSVQMTRGNRQGNNAFLEYEDNEPITSFMDSYCDREQLLKERLVSPESFDLLQKLLGGTNAQQN